MSLVRCILIDPKAQTVTEAECDTNRLEAIVALIDCAYFEDTRLPNGDHLLLDEEGLQRPYRGQGFFHWEGANQPFVGRGAIFSEQRGELVAPRSTLAEVRAAVRFVTDDVALSILARRGPFGA